MPNPLANKRVLLGVTGSIACYKSVDLASKIRQSGAEVDTILSKAAREFVTPLTFQSVTGRAAYTDEAMWGDAGHVLHVGLADNADIMVIAPITANTMAKLAHGIADNLLTVSALAARGPILIAPAMDGGMWEHPATQANLKTLQERGVQVAGPDTGHLASGLRGIGRMLQPEDLLAQIRLILSTGGPLSGVQIVITAGGTQEPIDPVRFITNHSSGKQGYALAGAALDLGADVILITAPSSLAAPLGATRVEVRTAEEMYTAVNHAIQGADVLVMAAAVADFTPSEMAEEKLKKRDGVPTIKLKPTADILGRVGPGKGLENQLRLVIGFAAESQELIENALSKLQTKNLDLIVANDISAADAGFQVDTNRVVLIYRDGHQEALPLQSKSEVAEHVMGEIARLLND